MFARIYGSIYGKICILDLLIATNLGDYIHYFVYKPIYFHWLEPYVKQRIDLKIC